MYMSPYKFPTGNPTHPHICYDEELASVGLVLVAIRAIMSDELFGSAGAERQLMVESVVHSHGGTPIAGWFARENMVIHGDK